MKPRNRSLFVPSIAIAISSLLAGGAHAQSGTWTGLTSGANWTDVANWNNGTGPIADGADNTADFSAIDTPAGAFTVNLVSARTIGNLNFGDTDPVNTAGSWNIPTGAQLTLAGTAPTVTNSVPAVINAGVSGTSGLVKNGAGELQFTANNLTTFSGPILLKAGTFRVAGTQANVQNAIGAATSAITFEGGTLTLNGALNTDNATTWGTFANPLTIAAGQTGTVNAPPRGAMSSVVTGTGTLNINIRATRWDITGNWTAFTGAINIGSLATGDFRINNGTVFNASQKVNITNAYVVQNYNPPNSGAVTTVQNIGELSGTSAALLAGNPVNGRFVEWTIGALNTNSEFAGNIINATGAARINKVGTGTLTLSGTNTYTGTTTVTAGTLAIGNGGGTGSLGTTNAAVAVGATLVFNRDNTLASTYPGILSGAGSVIKRGNGQVNFTGLNTYTAGTVIEGGVIGINSATSLGDAVGAVAFTTANGGIEAQADITSTRNFSVAGGISASFSAAAVANQYAVGGTISGPGSVVVGGAGHITFNGANTYGGTTTVNSGTLTVANTTGSATSTGAVALTGGSLAGTGTITGAVSAATGATLKPGALTPTSSAVGTLTTGSLALAGGTTLNAEFANTSVYDKIVVADANGFTTTATSGDPVMVDLRTENSNAKWTTLGTYNLIQYAGTFTGTANNLFKVTAASQQAGFTYTFSTTVNPGFLTLTISGTAPSVWNVDNNGTWGNAANWLNGIPSGVGVSAEFTSAITQPRVVTLDSARTVGSLSFNNANPYTINGTPTLTLDRATGNVQANVILGNHAVAAPVALADFLDVFLAHATDSLSFTKAISGTGGINKSSAGNLTLEAAGTFTGAVAFSNGVLTFANGALGTGSLTLDNATLAWAAGNNQDISNRTITFGDNPITFQTDDDVTLANDFGFGGIAPLTKDGFGKLTIAADTTLFGNITVANGLLALGAGGTSGNVFSNIALTGANTGLILNRTDDSTISGTITGPGTLQHAGSGNTTLNGTNTFSGATMIDAGSIILGNSLALSGSTVIYDSDGGTLRFGSLGAATLGGLTDGTDGPKNLVLENDGLTAVALTVGGNNETTGYAGNLSGLGSLTKIGTGTLTLSGQNTHAGGTSIGIGSSRAGGLVLMTGGILSSSFLTVTEQGTFDLNAGTVSTTGDINVNATATGGSALHQYGGTITATGAFNMGSNRAQGNIISLLGGTTSAASMTIGRTGLNYSAEPLTGSAGDGLYINGGSLSLTGALTVGNANSNSSTNARMDSGALSVGGVVSIGLNNGGRWSTLDISGGTFTSTEAVTGIQLGIANTGNATFIVRGGDDVTAGGLATVERIQLGQGALGGTHVVRTADKGSLYVGSGGIVIGDVTSVGIVRLTGGTLGAKAAWSSSVGVELTNSAVVKAADAADAAHDITLNGAVTGSGALVKTGAGILTLTGLNTYTGDTTVNAGKLAVNGSAIADTGKLVINGGQVQPTGTEVVGTLFFGGVQQESGTWGATGSGATHIDNVHFTGTGVVNVIAGPPVGYSGWAATNAGGQTSNLDFDNDGVRNGIEYFMNSAAGFTANPAIVGGTVSWTNGGNIPSSSYGTEFYVQTSGDLVTWVNVLIGSPNLTNTSGSVSYTPPAGQGKTFVRLVVTPN
ncbi:MAG: autotransporter-associated beta strand repeat-containing protein [Verrucomicrobiota bacterium]